MASALAPIMYDGSTNPTTFVEHFRLQARFQDWDNTNQLLALPLFLKGQAKENYTTIIATKTTVNDILAELIKMCERPRELLLEEFFERKLRPGETVSSFAKAIKTLLTEAEPTMSAETRHTLLLRQLGKSLPSHVRTQLNFNSRMEWNELLVNLDKSMPLESITPQWDLSTTQFPTSLIKQEPVEANWATTRVRDQNNNSISYSDRSSDNRQQTRTMRFNGYCNYCD